MRVSPFRYLRINGYLLLPAAYRSLSRLSSALSAKAFTLCSCSLDHYVILVLAFSAIVVCYPIYQILFNHYLASIAVSSLFNFQCAVVGSNGLEPSTSRLSGARSNHLSYEPMASAASLLTRSLQTPF